MYTVIILAFFGICLALLGTRSENISARMNFLPLAALAGAFAGVMVAITVGQMMPTHWVQTSSAPLTELHSSDGVSGGGFFLGVGWNDNDGSIAYVYRTRGRDGRDVLHSVSALDRRDVVYEDAPNMGKRLCMKVKEPARPSNFAFDWHIEHCSLHIPKGSVGWISSVIHAENPT